MQGFWPCNKIPEFVPIMKIKRIFAVIPAKNQHKYLSVCGIFCALTSGVYHCVCALIYRLSLSQWSHNAAVFGLVLGGTEGDSLLFIHIPNTYTLCQEPKVSGPLKSTVSAILRQQRDSLHRIRNSLSREWKVLETLSSSPSQSTSSNSSRAPNGSASSASATAASSSASKPPE